MRSLRVLLVTASESLGLEFRACLSLGIHALVIVLATLARGAAAALVKAGVGATRRGDELGRGGDRRLPVEDDPVALADDDRRPRRRARAIELVLDAEAL